MEVVINEKFFAAAIQDLRMGTGCDKRFPEVFSSAPNFIQRFRHLDFVQLAVIAHFDA